MAFSHQNGAEGTARPAMKQALRAVFTEIRQISLDFYAHSYVRMALNGSKNTENLPFVTAGGQLCTHCALRLPGERLIRSTTRLNPSVTDVLTQPDLYFQFKKCQLCAGTRHLKMTTPAVDCFPSIEI